MNICQCYNAAVLLVLCFLHGTKGKQSPQIIVERKVTKYGENLQLFCKIDDCCPNEAGWAVDRGLLFIDITLINPSSVFKNRYKASYDTSGLRLVIQNFSTSDLNKSHECIYDGDQVSRILFYDDVFSNNTCQEDGPETDSGTGNNVVSVAIVVPVIAILVVGSCLMLRKQRKLNRGICLSFPGDEEMQRIRSNNQTQCDEEMQSIRSDNQQPCKIFFKENGTPDEQQWLELFINIGHKIGEVWTTLGRMLGLTDAVISSIDKEMFQTADKAFAMLEKWIYHTGSSATKEKLSGCLETLDLTSLAVKVQEHFSVAGMNGELVEFKQQWLALFIQIGNNISDNWQALGRMLGLPNEEISSIDNEMFQSADKAFAMLENWINLEGSSATKDKLCECLDKLSLTSVAVIVQEHFSVPGLNAKIVEGKEETQPLIQFK